LTAERRPSRLAPRRLALALAVPILVAWRAAAAQQPEPVDAVDNGRRLADAICSPCHETAPGKPATVLTGSLAAPSFAAVMQKPEADATFLRGFITVEHVRAKPSAVMPDVRLSDSERDALVSYLLSLRRHP
jgi:mono/diheme cytochrome c family protein